MKRKLLSYLLSTVAILFFWQTGFSQNLLTNGDMESWTDATTIDGWTVSGEIAQESTIIHGGIYSAKQVAKDKLYQDIDVTPGKTYNISLWYYVDGGDGTDARIWSAWKDGSGSYLSDNSDVLKGPNGTYFTSAASWQNYKVSVTAPATAAKLHFEVRVYKPSTGSVAVYWDDFSVEEAGGGAATVAKDLFFSEYVEGSSSNRAIEIFNGTGADVDLSGYTVKQAHNGAGWGADGSAYALPLSGTVASGDVYVIANVSANAGILAQADTTFDYSDDQGHKVPFFTGNDALGLFKADVLIDVVGVPTESSSWAVAGVAGATQDHTLVRKSTITQGDTVWTTSAGTDADNSEWIVFAKDSLAGLGSHTFGTTTDTTAPTLTAVPDNGDTEVPVNTSIVLTFDEGIQNIDGSEITDANVASLLTLKETDASGADVPFTATIDAAKKVITVTPNADLKINQVYYGAINPVEDAAGNATTKAEMTFTTVTKYKVTFNVDMSLVNGFDPSTDSVFIAGTLPGWEEPGSNPDFKMTDPDGNMVYSLTLGLDIPIANDGKIEYKYFINAGWNTWGEWNGGDNRLATINGDTTLNAVFGNTGQPIVLNVPFVQSFDYVTANAPVALAGWTNVNVETGGVTTWKGKDYKSNKYVEVSSYGSRSTGADSVWLITPGINMDNTTNEKLSFEVNIGYWTHDGLSVMISTDYDQKPEDIGTATWTDVTSDFTIPSAPSSSYGSFANAGSLDVSGYTGTMYVAFVYHGDVGQKQTTTYQIDSVTVEAATGINNISLADQIALFPNPGNGIFNIVMNNTMKGEVNLKIVDVTGRLIMEKRFDHVSGSIPVNISNEPANLYFITISDAHNTVVKKFMKQ